MRKIVYVGLFPPENPSVGDHSQVLAIGKWFSTYFPNYEVVRFYRRYAKPPKPHPTEGIRDWNRLLQTVKEDDLIFIHSSGDFGTLFYWTGMINRSWHDFRRKLISQFPNNKIIQLPVTVFYHHTEGGRKTLAQDKLFYKNRSNLLLMGRDPYSYRILANHLECRSMFVPDFAFTLKPELTNKERKGALLMLRCDHETVFSRNMAKIKGLIEQTVPNVTARDINIYRTEPMTDENRATIINQIIDYYGDFKVVVTDRLHGMIFSVLSNTPCVCINDRIPHKASAYKDLLSDSINFVDKIEEIPDAVTNVLSEPFKEIDLTSHFTSLKEKVLE